MFIVQNGMPYYISENRKEMYPCEIDAFSYNVDFNKKLPVMKIDCILTDSEVRQKFGIIVVDSWDRTRGIIKKVSNKTVSSKIIADK